MCSSAFPLPPPPAARSLFDARLPCGLNRFAPAAPPVSLPICREKATEVLLETLSTPAVHMALQPVLALYACGPTSGLVVDIGESGTQVGRRWLGDCQVEARKGGGHGGHGGGGGLASSVCGVCNSWSYVSYGPPRAIVRLSRHPFAACIASKPESLRSLLTSPFEAGVKNKGFRKTRLAKHQHQALSVSSAG